MVINLLYFILNVVILYFLINFQKKNDLIVDNNKISFHKIHKGTVPLSGGIFLLINATFFVFFSILDLNIFLFLFSFFLVGLFSDKNINFKPLIRLVFQTVLTFFFIYYNNIFLSKLNIFFLDEILNVKILNSLFITFCVIVLINGLNLLDGKNTLVGGNLLVIFLFIYLINFRNNNYNSINLYIIIILFVFLSFNLFGKCFLGDSGIYTFGLLTAYYSIESFNSLKEVSALFIVNLLWLPAFENLFSILRRLFYAKSEIISPDKKHLHHLLDIYLKKNYKINYKMSNTICGLLINVYFFIGLTMAYNFYWSRSVNLLILIANITVYLLVYIKLFNKLHKLHLI